VLPNHSVGAAVQHIPEPGEHILDVAEHKPVAIDDNMGHVLHNQLIIITVLSKVFSFLFT